MKKRGEITVFLSLVVVCILSLCMGLLESARTAGSRLYAQMAAESAVSSVMSQYNRNLWDVYHLLFLETESEEAVEQSFSKYMDFYCDQENFYPMKLEEVRMVKGNSIIEKGGKWLEDGAVSYVNYQLPDVAEDLLGIVDEAEQAKNAGDFRELFEVCSDAGKKTRKLEKSRGGRILGRVYTLLVVCLGFVMFRATSVSQGFQVIGAMFTGFTFTPQATLLLRKLLSPEAVAVLLLGIALCLPVKDFLAKKSWYRILEPISYIAALVLLVLCIAKLASGGFAPFIYAQF